MRLNALEKGRMHCFASNVHKTLLVFKTVTTGGNIQPTNGLSSELIFMQVYKSLYDYYRTNYRGLLFYFLVSMI